MLPWPMISGESGLARYLTQIRRFPMLKPAGGIYARQALAREHEDPGAAHKLVTSHLRLVAKIAMGYFGAMVCRSAKLSRKATLASCRRSSVSNPIRGFAWRPMPVRWIRASIQEYILRSWSLVKMGTTASQKKLSFNLRRAKSQISAILDDGDMRPDQVKTIARRLGVTEKDVIDMNRRMSGDASLNSPLREESEGRMARLACRDDAASQEHTLAEREQKLAIAWLRSAMR